jgi:hypothetical protein
MLEGLGSLGSLQREEIDKRVKRMTDSQFWLVIKPCD